MNQARWSAARTVVLAGLLLLVSVAALAAGAGEARALGKGVIDYRLEYPAAIDLSRIPNMVAEIGPGRLGAEWTRVMVRWKRLQPVAPGTPYAGDANGDGYDDAYVHELSTVVGLFRSQGVKVILTPLDVPKWASNKKLWGSPPRPYRKGYEPFYAMDIANPVVLSEFGRVGEFLASTFRGLVWHFEVWNEPNLGLYLYPQNPPGARRVGARTYLTMLRAFSAGVRRAASDAVVIAGATSPSGFNNAQGTSPQCFAGYLAQHGATQYFDAYSHHPFGSRDDRRVAPHQRPNAPDWEVTLYNLNVLLKIFPGKDFYLTEYGFNSRGWQLFGPVVSEAKQASYLQAAYALVEKRYPRVRAMLWFVAQDMAPQSPGARGCYMGLRKTNGVRKPSWYAFAGGNAVTLNAPDSAPAGAAFALSGALSNGALGAVPDALVQLQARRAGGKWKVVAALRSGADGSFAFSARQKTTRLYRAVWPGVLVSAAHTVATPRR